MTSLSDWPLLNEAANQIDAMVTAGTTAAIIADGPILTACDDEPVEKRLATQAFRDLIGCGEVPVRAVRDDCGRLTPEPVQKLLAAANFPSTFFFRIRHVDVGVSTSQADEGALAESFACES